MRLHYLGVSAKQRGAGRASALPQTSKGRAQATARTPRARLGSASGWS